MGFEYTIFNEDFRKTNKNKCVHVNFAKNLLNIVHILYLLVQ